MNIDRYNLDILERDVLSVYIKPILEKVSFDYELIDRGISFDFSISTNYTDALFGKTTAIWMQPQSQGTYNITITFQSNKEWDYTIGVYARNLDFYAEFYGKNAKTYGSFVELYRPSHRLPGNWTISIILNSHRQSSSIFDIFDIKLPTPLNAVLFATATCFIAYLNIFLICDTYFKNKKEIVSNKRWLLCGIFIIISAYVIYRLYAFTTFIPSWSV